MSQIEAWIKNQKVKFGHVDSDDSGVIPSALKSQPKDDGLMFFVATVRDENFFKRLGKSFTNVLKRRTPHTESVGKECIATRAASQEELKKSILELNQDRSSSKSSE